MTSSPVRGKNRIATLDGLRGIAVIGVMLYHFTTVFPKFYDDAATPLFQVTHGGFGVHLFFMISGFVILMTMEKRGATLGFVKSRFIRLYPIYWVCLCLTFACLAAFPILGNPPNITTFLINFTMLQEMFYVPHIDSVYWSLTYELGFYVAIFAVFFLKLEKHIEWIAIAWIIGALIFKWLAPYLPHPLHYLIMINGYSHLFAAGLIFYRIYTSGVTPMRIAALCLVALSQFPMPFQYNDRGVEGALIIASLLVFFAAALWSNWLSFLGKGAFAFLGKISYSLYLIHNMVGFILLAYLQKIGANWIISLLIVSFTMIALASFLTLKVDEPVRGWLSKRMTASR